MRDPAQSGSPVISAAVMSPSIFTMLSDIARDQPEHAPDSGGDRLASAQALAQDAVAVERLPSGITEKSANVNGVRINYKVGGRRPVVVASPRVYADEPYCGFY
jgi:hypothetical protein